MPWERKRFKNGKIYVEVDDDGAMAVDRRGLVRHQYKLDGKAYTVNANQIRNMDGSIPSVSGRQIPPPPHASDQPQPRGLRRHPDEAEPPIVSELNAESPVSKLDPASTEFIEIYTDGACTGNPGPAGSGAILRWGTFYREIHRYVGRATNNIAELRAIELGLAAITKPKLSVRLYTDSQYCIGVLTGRYKVKKNRELILDIRRMMDQFEDIELFYVKGHAGHPLNERADELARLAIELAGYEQ